MSKLVFILLLAGLLAGCSIVKVTQLQTFHPDSRRLVLLTPMPYAADARLRLALAEKGFTLLQFATQEKLITTGGKDSELAIYDKAAARYGLTIHGTWSQFLRETDLMEGSCELTDLRTGEVILVIELSGSIGKTFGPLAAALDQYWGDPPALPISPTPATTKG